MLVAVLLAPWPAACSRDMRAGALVDGRSASARGGMGPRSRAANQVPDAESRREGVVETTECESRSEASVEQVRVRREGGAASSRISAARVSRRGGSARRGRAGTPPVTREAHMRRRGERTRHPWRYAAAAPCRDAAVPVPLWPAAVSLAGRRARRRCIMAQPHTRNPRSGARSARSAPGRPLCWQPPEHTVMSSVGRVQTPGAQQRPASRARTNRFRRQHGGAEGGADAADEQWQPSPALTLRGHAGSFLWRRCLRQSDQPGEQHGRG
jgi:hypothetical protein